MLPKELLKTTLGCVLHDIGKPIQRAGVYEASFERDKERDRIPKRDDHSYIGAQFIHDIFTEAARSDNPETEDILDAIRYHHYRALQGAPLRPDSPAFISYIADNIAAGVDRRDSYDEQAWPGFDKQTNLASVFNTFGAERGNLEHEPKMLTDRSDDFTLPSDSVPPFDKGQYQAIEAKLRESIKALDISDEYLTSLLTVLEATLSFVPSSTSRKEVADISLYDHLKLTGAFGSAIWHWVQEQGVADLRTELFDNAKSFYEKDAFLLVSLDVSGIQSFIYTIHSEGAAKQLRARSFYLEILVENALDLLLAKLELSRASLLYSGGGHAYLIAPNTADAEAALRGFEKEFNSWLLETHGTALWLGLGWAPFAAATVMESGSASYPELYREVSSQISAKKLNRYSWETIQELNSAGHGSTECKVCHKSVDSLTSGMCSVCDSLSNAAHSIRVDGFAYVTGDPGGIPLYRNQWLYFSHSERSMRELLQDSAPERVYGLNKLVTGVDQSIHLWIGNYTDSPDFSTYSQRKWADEGIHRLATLRLDVDNLGQAFLSGFSQQNNGAYNTFSRSATFSRSLSLFFRHYINQSIDGFHASIIYSGGDDVFVVGAWDDVLDFAVKLQESFAQFTHGKLTISGGLGIYPDKFPVSVMAEEVGSLESCAKREGKDRLTVFSPDWAFTWEDLRKDVFVKRDEIAVGLKDIEKGHTFAYALLGLLREKEAEWGGGKHKTISFARWAYLLARSEPAGEEPRKRDRSFTEKLHQWFEADSQSLELALTLYAYSTRKYSTRKGE
jgi:CRISPR-associated protein Csm1